MRWLCVAVCLLLVSTSAAQSSDTGRLQGHIIGSVVNDANEPIGYAILCTTIVRAQSANTSCGQETDAQGHFDINVPLETNRIFAQKPQAGYQPVHKPMDQGVPVKLSELEPVAHVKINIGERPGELTLAVTDRVTGKPIDSFTVRWIRIDDGPVEATDRSSKGRISVPANIEVILTVRADGYERWFYADDSAPSRPVLRLGSGEQRTIAVELEPQH